VGRIKQDDPDKAPANRPHHRCNLSDAEVENQVYEQADPDEREDGTSHIE
jgi:hypothetical protein